MTWRLKPRAVHPIPLEINHVHFYQSIPYRGSPISETLPLPAGFYDVELDDNLKYVNGVIFFGRLYPFIAPRDVLHNNNGRVKVLINEYCASLTVPILENDPLNSLFATRYIIRNSRLAQINE